MLEAKDFGSRSLPTEFDGGNSLRFGLDNNEAIFALRKFISDIEQGLVLLQKVKSESLAKVDDYAQHTLIIEYVPREKQE